MMPQSLFPPSPWWRRLLCALGFHQWRFFTGVEGCECRGCDCCPAAQYRQVLSGRGGDAWQDRCTLLVYEGDLLEIEQNLAYSPLEGALRFKHLGYDLPFGPWVPYELEPLDVER